MPRKDGFVDQSIREQLSVARGANYWRTLEEWADTDDFKAAVAREYPEHAPEWTDETTRRKFLKLMSASLALAGLHGCNANQPHEEIVPYVNQPEGLVPGKPQYYATAMPANGYGLGLLVESHSGRPTKIEGNPKHPSVPRAAGRDDDFRTGATDVFAQASALQLYDPDRSQSVAFHGQLRPWSSFVTELRVELEKLAGRQGRGLRILTSRTTSPTELAKLAAVRKAYPESKLHQFEPDGFDAVQEATRLAFGERLLPSLQLESADIVVSLDADFLTTGPDWLRNAREFTNRRRLLPGGDVQADTRSMNRLYAIESTPTLTGAQAEHRLLRRPSEIHSIVTTLAERFGVLQPSTVSRIEDEYTQKFVDVLVSDLQEHKGRCVLVAGTQHPPELQAVVFAINASLGNVGKTIELRKPFDQPPEGESFGTLADLTKDMRAGDVSAVIVLGANPVYSAPADVDFSAALAKVPFRVHLGLYFDETARLCDWHIPQAHFLESWGDVRAYDGTASLIQPLIAPLFNGKTASELLATLLDESAVTGHEILKNHWQQQDQLSEADFKKFWLEGLHDGVLADTAAEVVTASVQAGFAELPQVHKLTGGAAGNTDDWQLVFRPDPTIGNGEWANNGWLQELPKPFTKLTWDNAALMSPHDAETLGVRDGDVVKIEVGDNTIDMPVFRLPHQPAKTITLHLGYGRVFPGRVGNDLGVNVNPLRTTEQPWFATANAVTATGERKLLATTQNHHMMEGRELIKVGTADELAEHSGEHDEQPAFMKSHHAGPEADGPLPSMYPEPDPNEIRWGMVIDQSACLGCSACTIACQSENNIPVVGKEEVARGREMHWIRIDAYYGGDPHHGDDHAGDGEAHAEPSSEAYHQPVPCMHCEYAPCEPVCPVHATTHSPEGVNEMTYNRCIGTRYCANNCPYKVRRFNFFEYTEPVAEQPLMQLLQNPDVTVRSRGVMEKCTYCIQRIQGAKIHAEVADQPLQDGDVVTACQSVCPTQAIVFGNLGDADSRVSRANESPLTYGLLEHLNTRPRTRYGAVVRNPHPQLAAAKPHNGAH